MTSELREFLTSSRPTWKGKDVEAVQSKLKRVGVQSIPDLLLELKKNSLNESLRLKGEKRFCQSTLQALKKSAKEWSMDCERDAGRSRDRPEARGAKRRSLRPDKASGPRAGVSSRAPPAFLPGGDPDCLGTVGAVQSTIPSPHRPLEDLSDAELWNEYMSEGIAPPSFNRADLIAMLQAVRSWQSASVMELSQLCGRFGIRTSLEDSQANLCQRLKNKTWDAWDIPIQGFLGNGDMAAAYELLEHFQELEMMSSDELLMLCHQKGLPIEGSPDQIPMKQRLKLVAAWEKLPLAELEMECYRRGLPCPPVPLPGSTWPSRNELLRTLLQGMHNEALAKWLRQDEEEISADDELTSAMDEDLEGFLCLECHCWFQPEGEAAWVDGHKCCDDCAWRIYYEEQEKEARMDEDLEEAEVFEWMQSWRASRFPGSPGRSEPAPEPSCSEEVRFAESRREVLLFEFGESEGEGTDSSARLDEQIVCQHFERQIQGLKDVSSDHDLGFLGAWNFIAELPTDASEGEESPKYVAAEHWNFRPLWHQEKSPNEPPCRAAKGEEPPEQAPQAPLPELGKPPLPVPQPLPPDALHDATSSTERNSLHACFCYASPLAKGLRELNVRAEWEALTAEGLTVEVRNGTSEELQQVLLSKNCPEILHIAAHCAPSDDGEGETALILEATDGAPHVLPAEHLAELAWWDGIQLLVLLACSSQSLVQRLIQSRGLRRAVCCSAVVLDAASHVFCRTFYRALGAGKALSQSFQAAQAAIRYGTNQAFRNEAGKFVLLCAEGDGHWPLREVHALPPTLWPTWPRVEDYVGRESFTVCLANLLEHRRAVCLWGDVGSGKSALCVEFCRFFSAPGRRFAQGAFHVNARQVASGGLTLSLLQQLQTAVTGRCAAPVGGTELLRAVQEVDSCRRPWLLVVDGLGENDVQSNQMLSLLLSETTHLHLLLTARDPLGCQWAMGYSKVVDVALPQLEPSDSALLLARRARRPFFPQDFVGGGVEAEAEAAPLRMGRELLRKLKESPVMQRLKGHPGQIVGAAAQVGCELHSLLQHPLVMPTFHPA